MSIIVIFKRFGSPGLHNLIIQYLFFFSKHYEFCKTGALDILAIFIRFLEKLF